MKGYDYSLGDLKNYNEGYEYLLQDYARVEQAYQKYRKEAQKEVNYLVKEFECKKAADSYARATPSRLASFFLL